MKKIIVCSFVLIGVLLLALSLFPKVSFGQGTFLPVDNPVAKKVMVINYDPVIESESNRKLHEVFGWTDPRILTDQYINGIREVSGGYTNYIVTEWKDVNSFTTLQDGFVYTYEAYLICLQDNTKCHNPKMLDYLKIINDFNLCGRRNNGEIDEVWLWGGPWFGYWEAVMTGPNAFYTNASPITGTSCQKQLHIMGFNYERGVSEMLEDLGHRAEGTLSYVFNEDSRRNGNNNKTPWGKFALSEKTAPGNSNCGWMHYAPNSQSDYDWSNQRTVPSGCEDWLNYPNLTGAKQSFNCSRWNCNGYDFKKWWLSHLPKYTGRTAGKWNNWWRYILDYEEATTPPPLNPADLNQDGKVDIYDYNILVSDFGKTGSPGWIRADIIKNGKVDIYDYNELVGRFGE